MSHKNSRTVFRRNSSLWCWHYSNSVNFPKWKPRNHNVDNLLYGIIWKVNIHDKIALSIIFKNYKSKSKWTH